MLTLGILSQMIGPDGFPFLSSLNDSLFSSFCCCVLTAGAWPAVRAAVMKLPCGLGSCQSSRQHEAFLYLRASTASMAWKTSGGMQCSMRTAGATVKDQ